MPIRPENLTRYPADWKDISFRIRFVRALGQCECEGECGASHGGRCPARHNGKHPRTGSKVVLTVAHLDHTPENSDDANLLALCQNCHLAYDLDEHKATAARTKAAAVAEWNTPLPGLEPAAPERRITPALPAPDVAYAPLAASGFGDITDIATYANSIQLLPTSDEQRDLATRYVHRRAKALGWTTEQRATVLDALFQPPRTSADWENSALPRLT